MTPIELEADQELPSTTFDWYDRTGALVDFSSGYTLSAQIITGANAVALNKTSGVTGAATSPNVTIDWATTDLTNLSGEYELRVVARRTSDSKDRMMRRQRLVIRAAPS